MATSYLRRWLFVVPLLILIGERVYETIRKLNDGISDLSDVAYAPINIPTASVSKRRVPSLDELTRSSQLFDSNSSSCKSPLVWIPNRISTPPDSVPSRIPRIIHQTSRSRCLTPGLARLVGNWTPFFEHGGWSYYFHDDEAVDKLLSLDYPEFPQMKQISQTCIKHCGTLKADLWRYVILWVYGGLYADLDTTPNYENFNASFVTPDMQGFFVREYYGLLSQYFMVMAPRHPLMYYAIQTALSHLHAVTNILTQEKMAPRLTGPHALHRAFQEYRRDVGVHVGNVSTRPVRQGTYVGTDNTTIVVVGRGGGDNSNNNVDFSNEHIWRQSMDRFMKGLEYHTMGMKHFLLTDHGNLTMLGRSCIHAMRNSFNANHGEVRGV